VDLLAVLIVILIVAVIWRGPKTLPQIGSMLGRGVREARRETDKVRADMDARNQSDSSGGGSVGGGSAT
jgi:Sec-independent protein translocase protein TatA